MSSTTSDITPDVDTEHVMPQSTYYYRITAFVTMFLCPTGVRTFILTVTFHLIPGRKKQFLLKIRDFPTDFRVIPAEWNAAVLET